MKLLYFLMFIGIAFAADTCWHCENAGNNAECSANGYEEKCHEINSVCQIEIRHSNGKSRITKRCKQDNACKNNEKQNILYKECNSRSYSQEATCRCCCNDENQCNKYSLECYKGPTPPGGCKRIETIDFGKVQCTNGNAVGSVCTFSCDDPNYEIFPQDGKTTRCQRSREWTKKRPCCVKRCPPLALMDTAIVMDSSSSIKERNWNTSKDLVRNILSVFKVGDDSARFAVYRYNKAVDEDTAIFLNSYPTSKKGLLDAFEKINYNGRGTLTGKALRYGKDNVLLPSKGDRPGVPNNVLLLTDGKSKDEVDGITRELEKERNANVYVVWVKNFGASRKKRQVEEDDEDDGGDDGTEEQLRTIASKPENFFSFNSYEELEEEVAIASSRVVRLFPESVQPGAVNEMPEFFTDPEIFTGTTRLLIKKLSNDNCEKRECRKR